MNKELLNKFDDFVKSEKLDPYEVVISLMERALERASRKSWASRGQLPVEIDDDLRFVAFHCREYRIQFSESVESDYYAPYDAGLEDGIFIKNDEAFIEEEPSYQSLVDEFLEIQKKARLEAETRMQKNREIRFEEDLRRLLGSGVTREQIIERLNNEK